MNINVFFIFLFFVQSYAKNTFWIAKSVWFFFIAHKDNIFFLSYDTKNFRIAQKILDSNATLLPGFFLSLA